MSSSDSSTKMSYRFLGNSGLLVSKLSLGAWMQYKEENTVDAWYEMMKTAFKHGVNFFDTSEMYANGHAEKLQGGAVNKGIIAVRAMNYVIEQGWAWVVSNENVSTALVGASRPSQLEENLKALEFVDKITPEVKAQIDDIVNFVPTVATMDTFAYVRERHL